MSEKMTCPVCNSRTSAIATAVWNDDPCPVCGAPADVVSEVNQLREQRGSEELKTRVQDLLVEVGKLTAERDRLARIVEDVRIAMQTDG